jgi:hypothetical protein
MRGILRIGVLVVLLGGLGVPSGNVAAQQVAKWERESAEIARRLDLLEREVVGRDTALARADRELGAALMAGMLAADPELADFAERLPRVEAEAVVARSLGNLTAARALEQEAAGMRARYLAAQAAAVKDPALAARIGSFDRRVRERMEQADEEAGALWARYQELQERLDGAGDSPE